MAGGVAPAAAAALRVSRASTGTASALLVRHVQPLPDEDRQALRAFCAAHGAQLWWQGEGEPQPDRAEQTLGYRLAAYDLTLAWRPGR